jgi:hypothetical protein
MESGDSPGLQNRRAAGTPSPVGSTPTRFRQHFAHADSFSMQRENCAMAHSDWLPSIREAQSGKRRLLTGDAEVTPLRLHRPKA